MSLLFRIALYAALGALFGLALGYGWWSFLTGATGALLGIIQSVIELSGWLVGIVALLFMLVALPGVGTFSIGWFIIGAIVAILLFVLETRNAFRPTPVGI